MTQQEETILDVDEKQLNVRIGILRDKLLEASKALRAQVPHDLTDTDLTENGFFKQWVICNTVYDSSIRDKSSGQFNISKKINGKINVNLKKNESYIGVVEKTNFILLFENGDIKIKSGSANINKNSKLKFNISLLGKGKDQKIIFFINFLSDKGKEF